MSDPRPGSGLPGDEHGRLDPADLPEGLRSQDAELRTMARAEDIEPPPGLASRITQAMERQAAMGGPAVFLEAARGRSGRGMVRGFTASARSIFARGVPVMARLQAALLVVVVSLVLATGATVGATGAQAVIGVVQGGPAPTEDPTQPSERPTDPPARPSGSPGASPSGPLGSPGASALPSASPSALPSVSPGPSVSGSWVMASPSAIAPGESASGDVSTLPPKAASPEPASTDLVPPGSPSSPATPDPVSPMVSPVVAATRHLDLDGIEFDYPASWAVNDRGWMSTGFGWTLAFVGTQPWGPCAATDINCHYRQRLEPGQISVQVGQAVLSQSDICELGRTRWDLEGRGPGDPIATGSLARIAGRPAVRTDYEVGQADYYRSDEWRNWIIAVPGSIERAYTIRAMYRGPGVDTMRSELDELIASIRLSPTSEVETTPDDCGSPFPRD